MEGKCGGMEGPKAQRKGMDREVEGREGMVKYRELGKVEGVRWEGRREGKRLERMGRDEWRECKEKGGCRL